MRFSPLVMFMGCEGSGLYQYAHAFKRLGIPCGMPYSFLRSSIAAKRMPSHASHSYYSAIRRFFGDLGLPPIAEVPSDRIDGSQFEYFSTLICRCLLSQLGEQPYLCADHLSALAMPIVMRAFKLGNMRSKSYMFFRNPENEVSSLLIKYGQPVRLSEFIWRNTLASAIVNWGPNITFIESDHMTAESFELLKNDIFSFCGKEIGPSSVDYVPNIDNFISPAHPILLSSLTMDLYEALVNYIKNNDFINLNNIAGKIYSFQMEQNGWQYADCLDCGEIYSHANLLLNEDSKKIKSGHAYDDERFLFSPQQDDELITLLDISERKLVDVQNDLAGRLFLHTSSLNAFCVHKFDDMKALDCLENKAESNKYGCKRSRNVHKPHRHRRFKVQIK